MLDSSKEKCKNLFLSGVIGVDTKDILREVRVLKDEDVYTHFIQRGAVNSGILEEDDINDFLLNVYSDWYFLHKNTINKNTRAVKMLTEFVYTPIKLSESKSMLSMVKSHNYDDILPMTIQYINQIENKYFIAIRTDVLHNKKYSNIDYSVRLYINLAVDKVLEFAKIFLDRAYSSEFPAILKILNNDYRNDTITIYTDYAYVDKVIAELNDIKFENARLFEGMGELSPLLGRVNDYIGFGEVDNLNSTYLYSRCVSLDATKKLAEVEYMRRALMLDEDKVIRRDNGKTYTPTEYLEYLIEKNAGILIESKISELESAEHKDKKLIDKLKNMLDSIWSYIDINEEVKKLKRSFTRNESYVLEIDGVGRHEFDYIGRLYNMFSRNERKVYPVSVVDKKDIISSQFFKTTDMFEGIDTRNFLETYFRTKLLYILPDIISSETEELYRSKESTVLTRLKKRVIEKLKRVLTLITDEDDEGREYIDRYIYDLLRILSTDGLETVSTHIAGKAIPMDKSVPSEMVSLVDLLQENANILAENTVFIDNILQGFGVNKDNICLLSSTKNVCKMKEIEKKKLTGYHSKESI